MPFYELYALVLAASTWGKQWGGKRIKFLCDCLPVVQALARGTSRKLNTMALICYLDLLSARDSYEFKLEHIAGIKNPVADALSRNDMISFFQIAPLSEKQADAIIPLPSMKELQ